MIGVPVLCAMLPCVRAHPNCCEVKSIVACAELVLHFSAMDVLAWTTMKGAAKCDEHCELQNSVNQQGFERASQYSYDLRTERHIRTSFLCVWTHVI